MTEFYLPPKLDPNCQCICHTQPGVLHLAACCGPPPHNPARVVFEEMNRDPGKFYPMETCALAVQFAEALIKAGVIPAPQKDAEQ